MSPTDRIRPHNAAALRLRLTLAAAGSAWVTATAAGHPMLISRGEAVVRTGEIKVRIEIDPEDLLHDRILLHAPNVAFDERPVNAAAHRRVAQLAERLAVYDQNGERIDLAEKSLEITWPAENVTSIDVFRRLPVYADLSYRFLHRPRFLTFQFSGNAGSGLVLSQLILSAHGDGQPAGQTLRLTRRGNAETIELAWGEDHPVIVTPAAATVATKSGPAELASGQAALAGSASAGHCIPFEQRGARRFDEVFADVFVRHDSVLVELHLPLPLLETWIPIPRAAPAQVSLQERHAVLDAVTALLHGSIDFSAEGERIGPEDLKVRFASASGESTIDASCTSDSPAHVASTTGPRDRPIGFFTGRVVATWRVPAPDTRRADGPPTAGHVDITWRLFNSLVLTARANIHEGGSCRGHDISTYDPLIRVDR